LLLQVTGNVLCRCDSEDLAHIRLHPGGESFDRQAAMGVGLCLQRRLAVHHLRYAGFSHSLISVSLFSSVHSHISRRQAVSCCSLSCHPSKRCTSVHPSTHQFLVIKYEFLTLPTFNAVALLSTVDASTFIMYSCFVGFAASSDNVARLWNVESGEVKREYSGHQKALVSLAFRDDMPK
jgi:WD40 repeat protein